MDNHLAKRKLLITTFADVNALSKEESLLSVAALFDSINLRVTSMTIIVIISFMVNASSTLRRAHRDMASATGGIEKPIPGFCGGVTMLA